jgi:hypothetical protein
MTANASGLSLTTNDIPIVLGMVARGDRSHDIAAWFGVNQGRIKEAKDGKYGLPGPAPANSLPPKGPPGIKGRRLREAARKVSALLANGDVTGAASALNAAVKYYDANEA